jgi:hypothetical protein
MTYTVRPVHISPVELPSLGVIVLRIGEEIAVDIIVRQHAQDKPVL